MAATVNEVRGSAQRGIDSRSYTRVWRVVNDSTVLHPAIVIPLVPVIEGAAFPYDPLAICRNITADYEDFNASRAVIIVTASYETSTGGEDQVENENPLDDRPSISWDSREVRLPVKFDIDGEPIQNSAGQPFDPPPEEDFRILVYEYAHNIANYSEANAQSYRGAINEDNYILAGLAIEPFQSRISKIRANNQERNGVRFWRETVVVEIVDDWRLTLLDEGLMKKSSIQGGPGDPHYIGGGVDVVTPILDANGNPIFEPTLLDGNGAPLEGGEPVLLRFNTKAKPLRTFATLGLPTTNNP